MKTLFVSLLLLASTDIFAISSSELYSLYQNAEYQKACDEGVKSLGSHKRDEKYISLYAFACLQADKIDRLALPIIMLKQSEEARKNAAYFSTILLQKNLLITALENGDSLATLNLPTTDYILSNVFDLYTSGNVSKEGNVYRLSDPKTPHKTYRMRLTPSGLFIDEFYDTILTKQHIYR